MTSCSQDAQSIGIAGGWPNAALAGAGLRTEMSRGKVAISVLFLRRVPSVRKVVPFKSMPPQPHADGCPPCPRVGTSAQTIETNGPHHAWDFCLPLESTALQYANEWHSPDRDTTPAGTFALHSSRAKITRGRRPD